MTIRIAAAAIKAVAVQPRTAMGRLVV